MKRISLNRKVHELIVEDSNSLCYNNEENKDSKAVHLNYRPEHFKEQKMSARKKENGDNCILGALELVMGLHNEIEEQSVQVC